MRRSLTVCLTLLLTLMSQAQTLAPLPGGEQILVWLSPRNGAIGQVALVSDDALTQVLAAPATVSDVSVCGRGAQSADGRYLAFSVTDGQTTNLYQMTATNPRLNTLNTDINRMTCVGDGAKYSPDGDQVAYLTWSSPAESNITLGARLLVHDTSTLNIIGNFEEVAAFDLESDFAVYVTLFKNSANEYVEAGVNLWDGSGTRELATLFADTNNQCQYLSVSVAIMDAENIAVALGYRCRRGGNESQYQVYRVNISSRTAALVLQGVTSGSFFAYTNTHNILPAPNGQSLFQTLPDDLRNDSARLIETPLENPMERVVIPRYMLMQKVNQNQANALPRLSPNGQWFASVTNTPDNLATLHIVDLNAPTVPPIVIPAGPAGDTISRVVFTPDSAQLVYIAGNATNNATFIVDLTTGISTRLARGRYSPKSGVISPFSPTIALTDARTYSDTEPRYDMLVMQDILTGEQTDLLAGAEIVDGRVVNSSVIVPLAWRKGE